MLKFGPSNPRVERFVVRCNVGYLGRGKEVKTLEEATKVPTLKKAELLLSKQRLRGNWDCLWIEELPR